jgi:hypothetical protein
MSRGTLFLLLPLGVSATILQVVSAAYLGRTFEQVRQRPLYLVEEVFVQEQPGVQAPLEASTRREALVSATS